MKRAFVLILVLSWCDVLFSQGELRMYTWKEAVTADPDTVFGIDLSGEKLEKLPDSLVYFRNLRKLDLSKNRLEELPGILDSLDQLEELDISKNRFSIFPLVLTRMNSLKVLKASRNDFDRLPDSIRFNTSLEFLDLWDTPVGNFPEGFYTMRNLKKVDLSGIRYGPTFQKSLQERMPWVEFVMDEPCDCME